MNLLPRLVARFLRLLYTRLAFAYDAVAWLVSGGRWIEWARTGWSALPAGLCLELGHGPGHLLSLRQPGRRIVGVDASREMARLAARRQRRAGQPVRSMRALAQALPFAGGVFRGVLSTFPSEYAFDPRTVAEVHRVLVAGGQWLILPQVHISGGGPVQRLLAWVYRITGESGSLPEAWLALLRRQGFEVEVHDVLVPGARVQHLTARKARPQSLSAPARRG
jgi:ubiquinone/menaquinone biosynthesis C-methylase UbiE